jgi:hypothetical protein
MQKLAATADVSLLQPGLPPSQSTKSFGDGENIRKSRAGSLGKFVWLPEITSCIVSLMLLAAIIALLAVYKGQSLPNWPSMISINTLLAVLTSLLKAAILLPVTEGLSELKWRWFATAQPMKDMDRFDAATRGPWGSLLLMLKRRNILTYLGAVITVAALAIDPFTQQILQYKECLIPASSTDVSATITRTSNYTAAGLHTGAGETSLDGPMVATLYQGMLDPPTNATSSIAFSCGTGNCTFNGSYRSLAMCTSVKDISDTITGNGTYYNYQLPSGLATQYSSLFSAGGVDIENTEAASLYAFEAIMINCQGVLNKTTTTCKTGPWAFRADLYPCVHTYGNVNISRSVLTQELLATTRVPFMNMNNGDYFSLAGDFPSFDGVDCTPSKQPTEINTISTSLLQDGQRYVNISAAEPDIMWYNSACTYGLGVGSLQAIAQYFGGAFFSQADYSSTLQAPYGTPGNTVGNAWLELLYRNGTANIDSVTEFMQGLANAMTATMRQRGDSTNSIPVTGTALVNSTCIDVRWGWLTLPVALLALTFSFFASVMWISRGPTFKRTAQGVRPVWKSSSLPLLWCGLDDDTKRQYGTSSALVAMEERSDQMVINLRRTFDVGHDDGGRWSLGEAR